MTLTSKQTDKQYIANTYGRFDIELVSGKGSLVYDETGKEYIDLATGIAVNTFGVADDGWVAAVTAQMQKIQHTSNLYYSKPCIDLAEKLCTRTGAKKVFFSNSGAEANECAIKVARKWAQDTKGAGDYSIVTLKNSFHGRTVTTLSATGQDVFHKDFNPFTQGFLTPENNTLEEIEKLVQRNPCAGILIELVQGEGGVVALEQSFVDGLKALCERENLLFMVDEVQTGNGRCGALYAFQRYGITPDVVSTAKGLAGGLPMGATMLFEKVENTLGASSHGSTFGGNPVAAAAANYVIDKIDEKLLEEVREKSAYIVSELTGADGVKGVSGMGLMLGIETEKPADEVLKKCFEKGILPIKAKQKIRLLPALNIPMEQLKKATEILLSIMAE